MRRKSAPSPSMWVANVCRNVCGVTRRLVPVRRDPLHRSLAEHPDGPEAAIDVRGIEAAALRDADAGGVEELEQGVVAPSRGGGRGLAVEELLGLVLREKGRESLGRSGAPNEPSGILLDYTPPSEEPKIAPDRGELSPDARPRKAPPVHRPEECRELAQVGGVAAHRMRRRAALHGQVFEESGDGVIHRGPITRRPWARSPACSRTPPEC